MGSKYYVVFKGFEPGIYTEWEDAKAQTEGFAGASVKKYDSSEAAAEAFRKFVREDDTAGLGLLLTGVGLHSETMKEKNGSKEQWSKFPEIDRDAWAVDASCMGNPGIMEYRGVEVATGKELFRVGPFQDATNNIGEFLAIVHAMAQMTKDGCYHNIYSDSVSGMAWVRNRRVKTTLQPTARNRKVFELMARGVVWLNNHRFPAKVMKWQTDHWGEIPADFGRK